ncbi:MAG: hypothetical protein ACREL9_12820 [Gemmatimonadales bacterium]
MGKINLQRVVLGGLLAGVVLNVVDFLVYGVVLEDDLAAAMQALGKGPVDSLIPLFVVLDFLYGIALVYLYAAIRPRFGPGPRTAVYAGLIMWVLIALLHAIGEAPMGLMPQRMFVIGTLVALVLFPVAAVVGAKIYTET